MSDITIPSDTSIVELGDLNDSGIKSTLNNRDIQPILQGGSEHVNPCYIENIECTLAWTGKKHNDPDGKFTLRRNISGNPRKLGKKSYIYTSSMRDYSDDIQVIFIGQNGGYTDDKQLFEVFVKMTEFLPHNKFIVITSHKNKSEILKSLMQDKFGNKYINLNDYMNKYGLQDAGLKASTNDEIDILKGNCPSKLLADGVHFNEYGYNVLGALVANRIKQLGY